ncbi:hypothetical protein PL10110_190023 [Planktothrix agardhii]|nr:hypothetical protein PL10110_190023 [Planktothrix agardhii]
MANSPPALLATKIAIKLSKTPSSTIADSGSTGGQASVAVPKIGNKFNPQLENIESSDKNPVTRSTVSSR